MILQQRRITSHYDLCFRSVREDQLKIPPENMSVRFDSQSRTLLFSQTSTDQFPTRLRNKYESSTFRVA